MTMAAAVENQTTTTNGMQAYRSTLSACLDLFYAIGASRGVDITDKFAKALSEDFDTAVRILLWARDARGGAGERQTFRNLLRFLELHFPSVVRQLIPQIPEYGRWDDLLTFTTPQMQNVADAFIVRELFKGNALTAKWMPRQGPVAARLRKAMGLSTPKQYRKFVVELTRVVEQQMCANDWDSIRFSAVPSVASARYRKAFARHTANYAAYIEAVKAGKQKINASAVFPHDVLRGLESASALDVDAVQAQWDALPDFVGAVNVLPIVDVSGSMNTPISGSLTARHVAMSLGLYFADKNRGDYHNLVMTFSERPSFYKLEGNIAEKWDRIEHAPWGFNTNLELCLNLLLETAVRGKVPQEDMPSALLLLSDMQFDQSVKSSHSMLTMADEAFAAAGYKRPVIVFWNLDDAGNTPATVNDDGVVLISGYSPTVLKNVLALLAQGAQDARATLEYWPLQMMLATVGTARYSWNGTAEL
jgi:hypothetical protein